MSKQSISIHKTKEEDGVTYNIHLTIEEIENGWLVTKDISSYSEKGEVPMEKGDYDCKKMYFKENPLDENKAVWDKVKF